jgi:hypothetical protein
MKGQKKCIVYAMSPPRRFEGGLLGDIDLHEIHILVDINGHIFTESGTAILIEQRLRKLIEEVLELNIISIQSVDDTLWIQVEISATTMSEQVSFRELTPDQKGALGWRTLFYPCQAGTTKECLGFSAPASKDSLGYDYTVQRLVTSLIR